MHGVPVGAPQALRSEILEGQLVLKPEGEDGREGLGTFCSPDFPQPGWGSEHLLSLACLGTWLSSVEWAPAEESPGLPSPL